MSKITEERKQEFVKQLALENNINHKEMLATVELLCMDGKFEEAVKKYNSDKINFYPWVNKVLLLIHLKLNI